MAENSSEFSVNGRAAHGKKQVLCDNSDTTIGVFPSDLKSTPLSQPSSSSLGSRNSPSFASIVNNSPLHSHASSPLRHATLAPLQPLHSHHPHHPHQLQQMEPKSLTLKQKLASTTTQKHQRSLRVIYPPNPNPPRPILKLTKRQKRQMRQQRLAEEEEYRQWELSRLHWEDHYGYESPAAFDNSSSYRNNGLFEPYFHYVDYRQHCQNRYKSDQIDKKHKNRRSHHRRGVWLERARHDHHKKTKTYRRCKKKTYRRQRRVALQPKRRVSSAFFDTSSDDTDYSTDSDAPDAAHDRDGVDRVVRRFRRLRTKMSDRSHDTLFGRRRLRRGDGCNSRRHARRRIYRAPQKRAFELLEPQLPEKIDLMEELDDLDDLDQLDQVAKGPDALLSGAYFEMSDDDGSVSDHSDGSATNGARDGSDSDAEAEMDEIEDDKWRQQTSKFYDVKFECEILFKGIPWVNASKIPTMDDLENVLRQRQRSKHKLDNKTQYNLDKIYVKIYAKPKRRKFDGDNDANGAYTLVGAYDVLPYVTLNRSSTIFKDIGINLPSRGSRCASTANSANKSTRQSQNLCTRGAWSKEELREMRRKQKQFNMRQLSTRSLSKGLKSFDALYANHDFSKSRLSGAKYSIEVDPELSPKAARKQYYQDFYSLKYEARRAKITKMLDKMRYRLDRIDVGSVLYQATGNFVSVNRELYFVGQKCWETLALDKFKSFSFHNMDPDHLHNQQKRGQSQQDHRSAKLSKREQRARRDQVFGRQAQLFWDVCTCLLGVDEMQLNFVLQQWQGIGRRVLQVQSEWEQMMQPLGMTRKRVLTLRKKLIRAGRLCQRIARTAGRSSDEIESKRLIWKHFDQSQEGSENVSELSLLDTFDNLEYLEESDIFVPFEIIHIISLFAGFYYCKSLKIKNVGNDLVLREDDMFLMKFYFLLDEKKRHFKSQLEAYGAATSSGTATVGKTGGSTDAGDDADLNEVHVRPAWQVDFNSCALATFYEMEGKSELAKYGVLQVLPAKTNLFDEERLVRSKNVGEMSHLQGVKRSAREYEILMEHVDNVYAEVFHNMFGPGDMDSEVESEWQDMNANHDDPQWQEFEYDDNGAIRMKQSDKQEVGENENNAGNDIDTYEMKTSVNDIGLSLDDG